MKQCLLIEVVTTSTDFKRTRLKKFHISRSTVFNKQLTWRVDKLQSFAEVNVSTRPDDTAPLSFFILRNFSTIITHSVHFFFGRG